MNIDLGEVLSHWPAVAGTYRVQPVAASQQRYSGAEIWRVDVGERSYALRKWPSINAGNGLPAIHAVQSHLALHAPDLVPALEKTSAGATIALIGANRFGVGGTHWELSRWMSGAPVPRHNLTSKQLGSAIRALGRVHLGAMQGVSDDDRSRCPAFWTHRDQYAKQHRHPLRSLSEGMVTRVREISSIAEAPLREFWPCDRVFPERPEFLEAMELVSRAAKRFHPIIAPWANIELPLHPRHGDAHLGNFLFAGDDATALIDFGAADLDCHAADVGRLLGTAVGDDPQRRAAALDIYESIRPFSDLERAAVDIFDHGGVIVAASRWISHLQPDPPENPYLTVPPRRFDSIGFQRLCVLMERVRVIAGEAAAGLTGQSGTFA